MTGVRARQVEGRQVRVNYYVSELFGDPEQSPDVWTSPLAILVAEDHSTPFRHAQPPHAQTHTLTLKHTPHTPDTLTLHTHSTHSPHTHSTHTLTLSHTLSHSTPFRHPAVRKVLDLKWKKFGLPLFVLSELCFAAVLLLFMITHVGDPPGAACSRHKVNLSILTTLGAFILLVWQLSVIPTLAHTFANSTYSSHSTHSKHSDTHTRQVIGAQIWSSKTVMVHAHHPLGVCVWSVCGGCVSVCVVCVECVWSVCECVCSMCGV